MKYFAFGHIARLTAISLILTLFYPSPTQAAGAGVGSTEYIPCRYSLIAAKGANAVIAYSTQKVTLDPDTLSEYYSDVIVVKNVSSKGSITSTRTIALLPTESLSDAENCIAVVATSSYFYIAAGVINQVQDDPDCVEDYEVEPPVTCAVTITEYLQFWRSTNGTTWSRTGRLEGIPASDVRVAATASLVLVVTATPGTDPECVPGAVDGDGYLVEDCEIDRASIQVRESSSTSMSFRAPIELADDAELPDGYMQATISGGSVGILTWRNVNGEQFAATRKGSQSWTVKTKISNTTYGYAGTSASVGKTAVVAYVDEFSSRLSWRFSSNSGQTWASQKRTASLVTGEIYVRNAWAAGAKFYVALDRVPWEGNYYSSVYQVTSSSAARKFTVSANESISGAIALGTRTILVTRYKVGGTYYLRLYSFV